MKLQTECSYLYLKKRKKKKITATFELKNRETLAYSIMFVMTTFKLKMYVGSTLD